MMRPSPEPRSMTISLAFTCAMSSILSTTAFGVGEGVRPFALGARGEGRRNALLYRLRFLAVHDVFSFQFLAAEYIAQGLPEFHLERSHRHPAAVAGPVDVVAGQPAAEHARAAPRRFPMLEISQKRKDRVRKDGVGHGDVDMATASGRV